MTAPVCFVDTETLGLDPDINPIWEVGLITPDGGEHVWQLKVTPRDLNLAHPIALEIGKFNDRYDPDSACDPTEFCAIFRSLTKGLHLAGAVVSFDEERLRRMFWKHGLGPGWHYHLVDVENLAAGKLGAAPPYKSDDLSARIGVDRSLFAEHTALGDARWAKAMYEAVVS